MISRHSQHLHKDEESETVLHIPIRTSAVMAYNTNLSYRNLIRNTSEGACDALQHATVYEVMGCEPAKLPDWACEAHLHSCSAAKGAHDQISRLSHRNMSKLEESLATSPRGILLLTIQIPRQSFIEIVMSPSRRPKLSPIGLAADARSNIQSVEVQVPREINKRQFSGLMKLTASLCIRRVAIS